jgi:hypothetical protein
MTAIWKNDGTGWQLEAPTGFPDEATLHKLVEETPQILPLAGNPRLVIIGSEVALGNGYADLLAIEPEGRVVIIEVKLAKNSEARRAVVAQILSYAAHLHGLDGASFEQQVLSSHLQKRGFSTLAEAIIANDQENIFDSNTFAQGLSESLRDGRFRLVLVLDEAPDDLVKLIGYLQTVTDRLLIDLITVASFQIASTQILIPQRVEPEFEIALPIQKPSSSNNFKGITVEGADNFRESYKTASIEQKELLDKLCAWACHLSDEGLATLRTYHGKESVTLLTRLLTGNVGLVTIWNTNGKAYLQLWRSVFEKRAPNSLKIIETFSGVEVKNGGFAKSITEELLSALTEAYKEAATGKLLSQNIEQSEVTTKS